MNGQEKSQSLSSIPRRLGMAQEKPQGGGALRLLYPRQDRDKSYGSEIGLHTPKGRCAFNCSGREMLLVTEAKVFSHGAPISLGETLSSPRGGRHHQPAGKPIQEVPIGIQDFGIPKLSEYRFGIRTDNS